MKNKINVNISPNPLDLQTLHCSQNDTSERKFYFTLHNNGEVIDTTDISDPIFEPFSVYKGGTEELFPNALLNGYADMGSLNWIYDSVNTRFYTDSLTRTIERGVSGWLTNLSCERYTTTSGISADKTISEYASTGYVYIRDLAYTDATTFKASLQGEKLYYKANTNTPGTSPIIADIQYPDEEKTEQEFTYRESPTTLDGNAIIEKLYGNTIVWNQLVQNGNFADTSNWVALGTTYTVANNVATVVPSANGGSRGLTIQNIDIKKNHHYLIRYYNRPSKEVSSRAYFYSTSTSTVSSVLSTTCLANTKTLCEGIITPTVDSNVFYLLPCQNGAPLTTDTYEMSEVNIFDLTAMFGSTKADEIYAMEQAQAGSGVAYFRSLYPLPYYQYDAGSLLSFNGSGIKTVGKNLLNFADMQDYSKWSATIAPNGNMKSESSNRIFSLPKLFSGNTYTISLGISSSSFPLYLYFGYISGDTATRTNYFSTDVLYGNKITFTAEEGKTYCLRMGSTGNETTFNGQMSKISYAQLEIGDATDYEPYTTSTTSIPTLTYFPTGMKSAGNVFDELTNSKAITRIGEVDLGTLNWYYTSGGQGRFASGGIETLAKAVSTNSQIANIKCVKYPTISAGSVYSGNVGIAIDTNSSIWVYDTTYGTDSNAFKTAMSGIYLQYELKDEEVTNFTQASLICEDGESTLYQDVDSLVCDCTEDFSKDSGFKDCKIKFTNDDGVVYSNKIQLHIERKP